MSIDPGTCAWVTHGQPQYVWFENNAQSFLDDWKLVAVQWQAIGTLISTSRESVAGRVVDFAEQALAVDGVDNLISGFKLSDFWDFAGGDNPYDTSIWQSVRDLASDVSSATAGNPVVFDNETNFTNLLADWGTVVDPDQLAAAILSVTGSWPEIWHWPGTVGTSEPDRQAYLDWATGFLAALKHSHLIESSSAAFTTSAADSTSQENFARTLAIDSGPYSIVYLDNVTGNMWDLDDAWRSREDVKGQATIFYPGTGDINNPASVKQGIDYADWIKRSCYKPGHAQLHYGKGKTFWEALDEPEPKPQRAPANARDRLAELVAANLRMPKK